MANVKISQLPSLSTMTDLAQIPVVAGGTTYQITGANLNSYFNSGAGNITSTTDVNITIDTPDSSTFNWEFSATGLLTAPGPVKPISTTLSALGSAASAGVGARAFITDSDVVASGNFGAVAAHTSGANAVPVYSDGTNWRIG